MSLIRFALPRARAVVVAALALTAACGKSEPALVPTTLVLSTTSVTLDAIGATQSITAAVNDQKGGAMTNVAVSWTSSAPGIASVTGTTSATATAVTNGVATLTATAGSLTKTVTVIVAQNPGAPQKAAGDGQAATVNTVLGTQLRVLIADRLNVGVPGRTVTFTPVTGSGATAPGSAVTGADGIATTTWTLGSVAGAQLVNVSVSGSSQTVSFNATANAGPAATIAVSSGNTQFATFGTAVAVPPAVRVTDAFGNAKPGSTVTFAVTTGGGSITGASAVTNASGIATVGGWTLGPLTGSNSLTATLAGVGSVTFTATASGGLPAAIAVNAGNNQTVGVSSNTPVPPSVRVTDANGNATQGVPVTFAVASGGGTITGASATTNTNGVATVGSWTVGAAAGTNTLTATVGGAGITGNPLTFTATSTTGSGNFNIELRFLTTASPAQTAAFNSAVARWQAIIASDIPPVPLVRSAGACGSNSPAINETIDDIIIFVTLEPIDGTGNVLGSAGPCTIRTGSLLPVTGRMRFDTADLTQLENSGRLEAVILHEMGHVLGIGTIWDFLGFLVNPSLTLGIGADTYFSGSNAIAGFNSIGGSTWTGGSKVPVENALGGSGTQDGHWREGVLANELMTGFINAGTNPLSMLTIRSMQDLGYIVNTSQADTFTLSLSGAALRAGDEGLQLKGDLTKDPMDVVDPFGRLIRRIIPR